MYSVDSEFPNMSIVDKIFNYVSGSHREEDLIDRLNYRLTATMLLTAALAVFAKV